MKKILFFALFFCALFFAEAQNNTDSINHFYYWITPLKATVYYKNDSAYTGMLTEISDRIMALLPLQSTDSVASRVIIPITDIQKVKVKRHAAQLGMVYGGGAGFVLGGLSAVIINIASGDSQNNDGSFILGGIIGAVPGVLAGAFIGGIVTRGGFTINSNIERARKLGKVLDRRDKTLNNAINVR